MAGINIDADIQARGFIKGVDDMAEALGDLQKEVEDVQKDGDKSLEKLEKSFAEAAKASRDAGDDIKKGLGGGTKAAVSEAEEGLKNFKEESISTAKESAASFDGSAESIIDSFQEIAANAFVGFGTAGIVAGLAAAAGIGAASAAIVDAEEKANEAKIRVTELGTAMIEAGADGAKPAQSIADDLLTIVTNGDDAVKTFEDISKKAEELGLDADALATAYAGGEEAIQDQIDAVKDLIKQQSTQFTEGEDGQKNRNVKDLEHLTALQTQQKELEAVAEETKKAAEAEQNWLDTGGAEILAKAGAIDQINAAYDDAVYSVDNFKNAETGIYDLDAYAASIEERARLLEEYQTNLAESGLTTEQKAALNEMGVEQANAILKGLKDPNTSQATKDTITKGLKTASQEGSGVAKKEIEDAFKKPVDATVKVKADTATAQADLDNLIKARTAIIKLDFQDRYGKRVY